MNLSVSGTGLPLLNRNSNNPPRGVRNKNKITALTLPSIQSGKLSWLTPSRTEIIRREIYQILENTMMGKKHHNTLHAEIMGQYARQAMRSLNQSEGMQNLAYLIGLSHDVIQGQGPKINEQESAKLLIEQIKNLEINLAQDEEKFVKKFIFQTIYYFTTLDFDTLRTLGENKILQNSKKKETLLTKFGEKLAQNDLFSKIDFFGKPQNFEKIGNQGHDLTSEECKVVMLVVQMYQVNSEFNSPLVYRIDTASLEEKSPALSALIHDEISKEKSFWRDGMPPGQAIKQRLACEESDSLEHVLQEKLLDSRVLNAILKSITFLNELSTTPSYEDLKPLFFQDDRQLYRF